MDSLKNEITIVNGRPIPKDPLNFFQYKKGSRVMVTITDSSSVWKNDLVIAERIFADMIITPCGSAADELETSVSTVRDILQQRMKYPGVKEDPELEKIAKTWILPNKLHAGPSADAIITDSVVALETFFEKLKIEPIIHFLKIELSNAQERQAIYKLLDQSMRPSLILVKWTHDLDENVPTANCGGHILNIGYSLVAYENNYGLYMFRDQPLYDICSMKTPSLNNPIMDSILQSVHAAYTKQSNIKTAPPSEETKSEA
jgi:hypothetical protein